MPAVPLTVLVFVGAFVPIVGAFVSGAFAVLIALVSNGLGTALAVLGVVLVVQALEGNVLEPFVQGRGLGLHPVVVLLAVSAGGTLAGIVGAFLAVPIAAVVSVVYRYARDLLDGRVPEADADPEEDDGTVEDGDTEDGGTGNGGTGGDRVPAGEAEDAARR